MMCRKAFTIVELLVVITIIVILMSMLAPVMDKAFELSARAICASQQHQVILATIGYAGDQSGRMPSGIRNGYEVPQDPGYGNRTEHVTWVPTGIMDILKQYAGTGLKDKD